METKHRRHLNPWRVEFRVAGFYTKVERNPQPFLYQRMRFRSFNFLGIAL